MAAISQSLEIAGAPSVLWKAFDVLGSFSQSRRTLTLSEIARNSGLPKSTVHRILAMLLEVKAVERAEHGYRIGLTMFAMGTCTAEVELRDQALPHLHRLRRLTGQTVQLAVIDGLNVVYLEKLAGASSASTPAVVGGRLPAHATAVGKALLAFSPRDNDLGSQLPIRTRATMSRPDVLRECLAKVRQYGIATDREEAIGGLACVASPIVVDSLPVAAVSVAFPATAGSGQRFVNPLRETSTMIGRALAGRPRTVFSSS